jgi:hypothetical protein
MPKPATVIIGNHTQGLGIVRSAAVAGGQVWVVNDRTISLTRFSKYLSGYKQIRRGTLACLSDTEASEELLEALFALPVTYPALLFGVNEDISDFIYRHSKLLKGKYFIPDVRLDKIYDKHAFNSLLPNSAQIRSFLCSETKIQFLDEHDRFILKGRQGNAFRRITGQKAVRLDGFAEHHRERLFRALPLDQIMIQEIVETDMPVVSVCSFSLNGQISAIFGYEKLRQHPTNFGTGTYLRSIRVDPLQSLTEQILKTLQFTGISEIEFIYDRRTGTPKVIEMNPRTWKSIHFASQCGQNLVARYLTYVATGRAEPDYGYMDDQYWADLATDIPQILRERLWGYNRAFFECTWDRSDPWPTLVLWTVFPLIALEERVSKMAVLAPTRKSARYATPMGG